jgi:hypothetical protein
MPSMSTTWELGVETVVWVLTEQRQTQYRYAVCKAKQETRCHESLVSALP